MSWWRGEAVAVALRDVAGGYIEANPKDADWINQNIIWPVWGPSSTVKNTEYCGCALQRWWRFAYMIIREPPDNFSSPGRIRYNFAGKGRGRVFLPAALSDRTVLPGDAVLHCCTPGPADAAGVKTCKVCGRKGKKLSTWNGHVMMCLSVNDTRVLVAEGNHGQSLGPSGRKYTSGTRGEDLERRQGLGVRWLRLWDPYISCVVSPNESEFAL